ncbi:YeeE/YedE family protein [Aggregicoccus sp. 17bor-14]|uniref:YeeE/YedE family protein n=1 Tax=Myxococcaceae TaxID=31 RepID=UPI00129D0A38|nr:MULTISPECIES: YeeE/YedE family protein [Myxococcaceae]MBF5046536.1 YeeE/YedE family protein [Simulacricoccus sp. 17bor-14]MRI92249.1 YeeE/YedE family protein [Aggregicoccus sp. 17bor-14]
MTQFLPSLLGGVLIGLSASLLLLFNGRIAGISGIAGGLLAPARGEVGWRLAFVAGLVGGGLLVRALMPGAFGNAAAAAPSAGLVVLAGLLVGFGTRLGNGCTSGHGVCGLSRGATRSLAATLTFVATGMLAVFLVRQLSGGAL